MALRIWFACEALAPAQIKIGAGACNNAGGQRPGRMVDLFFSVAHIDEWIYRGVSCEEMG